MNKSNQASDAKMQAIKDDAPASQAGAVNDAKAQIIHTITTDEYAGKGGNYVYDKTTNTRKLAND